MITYNSGIFRSTYRKVPVVVALPKTTLDMYLCNLKGDTVNDADTAGILGINADIFVKECTLAHFKSGGIMLQSLPQTNILIEKCNIVTCSTNGIYI